MLCLMVIISKLHFDALDVDQYQICQNCRCLSLLAPDGFYADAWPGIHCLYVVVAYLHRFECIFNLYLAMSNQNIFPYLGVLVLKGLLTN